MFDEIVVLIILNDCDVGLIFNFDKKPLRLSETLSTYPFTVGRAQRAFYCCSTEAQNCKTQWHAVRTGPKYHLKQTKH
ncbi:MAG: hypothetical protein EZS28_000707 [Streblomastix strix]|uniref:Uncharacterized protein n=1 Tax=Streblomastix strix TaxID=222440 RepID=A0A5J4XBA4_9EUKA|nr:MAG: hypothetical protein EZS28_000707 [Streblomastix strix]